jgi:hypothetical protein
MIPGDVPHPDPLADPKDPPKPRQISLVLVLPKDPSSPVHHVPDHDHPIHLAQSHCDVPRFPHVEVYYPCRDGLEDGVTGWVGEERVRDLWVRKDDDVGRFGWSGVEI